MLNYAKNIALLVLIAVLPGCAFKIHNWGGTKPASIMMELPADAGPDVYRQGYKDGCESGYSGYANNFNKLFYTWKQDPYLVKDPLYYQVWKDAYTYCANYAMMIDEHGLGNWR